MAGMRYCDRDADPSKSTVNTPPKPRDAKWLRWEVLKLVQVAWRHKYYGLSALMATAWDSSLSPIDNRRLTPGRARNDNIGIYFEFDRTKSGAPAAATLTQWFYAILMAYLERQFGAADLLTNWTRCGRPVSRTSKGTWGGDHGGGRHVPSRPYTKSSLNQDFSNVRESTLSQE
jgi:hypothetical protein